jgi:hypothetical protein
LKLGNNPQLTGCVPIYSTTLDTTSGTNISGVCETNYWSIETQQRNAAASMLPELMWSTGSSVVNDAVQQLVGWMANLGSQVGDWEVRKELRVGGEPGSPAMSMVFQVINGTEYLTSLKVSGSRFNAPVHLNVSLLADFVQQLPRLEYFECDMCNGTLGQQLPAALAVAAPNLHVLRLSSCGLAGSLPLSWGNWSSLEQLNLAGNRLTGALPEGYAALGKMQALNLADNRLQGTLPTLWGQSQTMPNSTVMIFSGNQGMYGTVPSAWSHFSAGSVDVRGTHIGGCAPGSLLVISSQPETPTCSGAREPLLALRVLISAAIQASGQSFGFFHWYNGEWHTIR